MKHWEGVPVEAAAGRAPGVMRGFVSQLWGRGLALAADKVSRCATGSRRAASGSAFRGFFRF
jgi:hypothetical protein